MGWDGMDGMDGWMDAVSGERIPFSLSFVPYPVQGQGGGQARDARAHDDDGARRDVG